MLKSDIVDIFLIAMAFWATLSTGVAVYTLARGRKKYRISKGVGSVIADVILGIFSLNVIFSSERSLLDVLVCVAWLIVALVMTVDIEKDFKVD